MFRAANTLKELFAVETAGSFDQDAELKIWIAGMAGVAIEKSFNKNVDIYAIQSLLANYVLKADK